jgi:hypothetical protein
MALPTDKILLRSPYWITKSDTNLSYISIALRVWTGALADEPSDLTISLRSTALNGVASIDIAELARDFVEVSFSDAGEESNAVLISQLTSSYYEDGTVYTETKEYFLGLDGYGTFTDGANYSITERVLMSTDVIRSYSDTNNRIPVLAEEFTGYKLQTSNGAGWHTFHTVSGLTSANSTEDAVAYINTSQGGVYAQRVVVEFSTGADEIIYVEYQECNKYGHTPAYFVNRFGAMQQVHFTGRFNISMQSKDTKYTRNILEGGTYNEFRHQQYVLSKNGSVSLEFNTGWVPEQENDTFLELIMSEQIWLQVDSSKFGVSIVPKQSNVYTMPVHLTTKNLNVKSKINDKLINYTFKFEGANDWINSIR